MPCVGYSYRLYFHIKRQYNHALCGHMDIEFLLFGINSLDVSFGRFFSEISITSHGYWCSKILKWNGLTSCQYMWRWQLMCPCCQPYQWPCRPARQTTPLMLSHGHLKYGWFVCITVVEDLNQFDPPKSVLKFHPNDMIHHKCSEHWFR